MTYLAILAAVLLAAVIPPCVGDIVNIVRDLKNRPYVRRHQTRP